MSELNPNDVYKITGSVFPKKNDQISSDYVEETEELDRFGIKTPEQLHSLLSKRKKEILEIDASPLDEQHLQWYSKEYGEEFVRKRHKEGYWFSYPALIRLALELEFQDDYREFANERDGIPKRS